MSVVKFPAHKVRAAAPDAGFLGCPQCGGDEFAVVCRGLPARPFVAALICAECDPPLEITVADGVLTHG
jgi:hypothetical protein